MADPKPIRDASPRMLLVTSTDSSSRPLRPRLMTYTMSNARSDSMMVMTRTTMLIGLQDREDDPEEGLALGRAVDRGGLLERRVDALQAGQVQDHDVADVAPARGDEDGRQVDVAVAQPVDEVALLGRAQDVVEEAPLGRVHQLPDEADDGQRQDDRQVQGALVEARARGCPCRAGRPGRCRCGVAMNRNTASQMMLWVRAGMNGG